MLLKICETFICKIHKSYVTHFKGFTYQEPYLHWLNVFRSPEALQEWNQQLLVPVMNLKSGKQSCLYIL